MERSPFANDSVSPAQLLELRAAAALRRRDHLLVLVDRVPDRLAPQPRVASNDRRREDGNQLGLPVLREPRREAASDGALGLGIQEDGHVFESTHLGVFFRALIPERWRTSLGGTAIAYASPRDTRSAPLAMGGPVRPRPRQPLAQRIGGCSGCGAVCLHGQRCICYTLPSGLFLSLRGVATWHRGSGSARGWPSGQLQR